MNTNPILKDAHDKGYAKGYAAGQRRKARAVGAERAQAAQTAFWQRALLVALPAAMTVDNWKRGEKPITTLADRTRLAADFADQALLVAQERGRV